MASAVEGLGTSDRSAEAIQALALKSVLKTVKDFSDASTLAAATSVLQVLHWHLLFCSRAMLGSYSCQFSAAQLRSSTVGSASACTSDHWSRYEQRGPPLAARWRPFKFRAETVVPANPANAGLCKAMHGPGCPRR